MIKTWGYHRHGWEYAFAVITPDAETTMVSTEQGTGDSPAHSVAELPAKDRHDAL